MSHWRQPGCGSASNDPHAYYVSRVCKRATDGQPELTRALQYSIYEHRYGPECFTHAHPRALWLYEASILPWAAVPLAVATEAGQGGTHQCEEKLQLVGSKD